jgi:hypothetical protein
MIESEVDMSRLRERVKRRSKGRTLKDRPDTSEIEPLMLASTVPGTPGLMTRSWAMNFGKRFDRHVGI